MLKRFAIIAMNTLLALFTCANAPAATISTHKAHSKTHRITETATAQKKMTRMRTSSRTVARRNRSTHVVASTHRRHRYYERFSASSFADNQVEGDITAGEDPMVRAAALEALGNMNGTIVAVDPDSGRILAMVNQKLALSAGAQPCSTIKVAVALAALSENVITKDTEVPLGKYWRVDLTTALAKSNNAYFEAVGRKLGFERVSYYAHQFGLGELAGWQIGGAHLGTFPQTELDQKLGGVGKMCSFGESISLTPLQLAALIGSLANGGTLYYMQHPTTPDAVTNFIEKPVLGKTGTCSKDGTRFGWFGSYANTQYGRIVTVIFLEGGRPTFGPKAAELAGHMYRNLYDHEFFAVKPAATTVRTAGSEVNPATVGAPQ